MSSESISNQLEGLTLEEVIPQGKELGRGAYGKVFMVNYLGVVYAAKEIHSLLLDGVSPEEKKAIKAGFIRECYHSSLIRHPNIVQFKGVYYTELSDLPIMVMELMTMCVTSFVKKNQSGILMKTKVSILYDVSLGLGYLHGRHPAIIHRDLSSNNVLLTSNLTAKISDLGMAKMIRADSKQTKSRLTRAPGTLHFMPPEALEEEDPVYGTPVDVFSFAGVALHLFSEEWPTPASQVKKDLKTKKLVALTEVERRQRYLNKMTGGASILKDTMERCLENDPSDRPLIKEVAKIIRPLKESSSENTVTKSVDVISANDSNSSVRKPPPWKKGEQCFYCQEKFYISLTKSKLRHHCRNCGNSVCSSCSTQTIALPHYNLLTPVRVCDKCYHEVNSNNSIISKQKENGIPSLTNLELNCNNSTSKKPQELPHNLHVEASKSNQYHVKWISCSSLPSKLYQASVAVLGNRVFVTAGTAPDDNTHANVYSYDIGTDKWTTLPQPGHLFGVLHVLGDILTIFGGSDPVTRKYHKKVTTYNSSTNCWCVHYPDMINVRYKLGVTIYHDFVIAMGGKNDPLTIQDSIEIMNFRYNLQWKEVALRLPVPMWNIKPTLSGENITIIGHSHAGGRNDGSYMIPVASLLGHPLSCKEWSEMCPAPYHNSATIPYSNPPVLIGGSNTGIARSQIVVYDQPTDTWEQVDSLTSPRNNVGVSLIKKDTIIVIGGTNGGIGIKGAMSHSLSTVQIGHFVAS